MFGYHDDFLVGTADFKERLLGRDDVTHIATELLPALSKANTLGRILLPAHVVDALKKQYTDPQEILINVIDEFVQQANPRATWSVVLNALRHPFIRRHDLADEIEKKYDPQPTQDGMSLMLLFSTQIFFNFIDELFPFVCDFNFNNYL